ACLVACLAQGLDLGAEAVGLLLEGRAALLGPAALDLAPFLPPALGLLEEALTLLLPACLEVPALGLPGAVRLLVRGDRRGEGSLQLVQPGLGMFGRARRLPPPGLEPIAPGAGGLELRGQVAERLDLGRAGVELAPEPPRLTLEL